MKQQYLIITFIAIVIFQCSCTKNNLPSNEQFLSSIDESLVTAGEQYKRLLDNTPDSVLPRTVENNEVKYVNIYDWTSGFFPASLWYLYTELNDPLFLFDAKKYTKVLEPLKDFTGTHDLGFMVNCPYGLAYKITGDTSYANTIIKASQSLITRYNPTIGLIQSWDSDYWQFPVIIDNMMNLEMLFDAAEYSTDSVFYNIAVNHANVTLKNHFRADHSTYHLVDYDTVTGNVLKKQTVQGFSDSSAWSRGQAWGLYGYTVMFRETSDSIYLNKAIDIADLLINYPDLPDDGIAYWDYNAKDIPNAPRDVAAAAIMASAMIELDNYVSDKEYLDYAKKVIWSLMSEEYLAQVGENHNFLLKHATGHLPANSEIDVPLIYADYYFVECLVRLKKKLKGENSN